MIRAVRTEDSPGLVEIYGPIVRDTAISFEIEAPTIEGFVARIEHVTATDPWLVCERAGAITGYAYATSFRSRPAYATTRETTVYVHPTHQRQGVGRSLMTALLKELTDRGACLAIAVIALPGAEGEPRGRPPAISPASVELHESLGFRRAGTLNRVARKFDTWWDEGFWQLDL